MTITFETSNNICRADFAFRWGLIEVDATAKIQDNNNNLSFEYGWLDVTEKGAMREAQPQLEELLSKHYIENKALLKSEGAKLSITI